MNGLNESELFVLCACSSRGDLGLCFSDLLSLLLYFLGLLCGGGVLACSAFRGGSSLLCGGFSLFCGGLSGGGLVSGLGGSTLFRGGFTFLCGSFTLLSTFSSGGFACSSFTRGGSTRDGNEDT